MPSIHIFAEPVNGDGTPFVFASPPLGSSRGKAYKHGNDKGALTLVSGHREQRLQASTGGWGCPGIYKDKSNQTRKATGQGRGHSSQRYLEGWDASSTKWGSGAPRDQPGAGGVSLGANPDSGRDPFARI